ncbi:MAG: ribose-phosphate pyrophosphokinase [Planctomycetes bacterium]|jgi:ribose-phosphate pyrophosphokinase|nr:ribose-phosphate pyrophosphokinase [Planctomycetota bacterium]
MKRGERLRVFAGRAHPQLARDICAHMGIPIGEVSISDFPDGEINLKVECDVRGADVFVVQPTCPPVHDSLFELLSFIDCLRRASAETITAVIPYFGYARKDRKDEGRVPINAKLVANLITTAGAQRVVAIDLHAAQIQGFFDIPVDHLYARPVLMEKVRELGADKPIVVSPDVGGTKLARAYAKDLRADLAIVDKRRISGRETVAENVVGDVSGRDVVLVDDMISTGGSISDAARIVKERGARKVFIVATHAVLCGDAVKKLDACPAETILFTDTIPVRGPKPARLVQASVAPLLARAIDRIHRSESVSSLFDSAPRDLESR